MTAISNNLLVKQLIEFGLSEKEAKVYLALLELEVAGVSEIAKTANINRSTAYVVLEMLKKKGLVSVSEDKKVQGYVAVSPDLLLQEAENRSRKTEEIKNKISNIVPELKGLHKNTKRKPKIRVFEGKQGVLATMEESLNTKEKIIRVCSSHENWFRSYHDFRSFLEGYVKRRIQKKIKMHGIHPDNIVAQELLKIKGNIDKTAIISKEKYKFPAEIAIFDNKIGYISPDKKGFAIIIESKEIADVMKNIFDLAFKEAKRLSKDNKKTKK